LSIEKKVRCKATRQKARWSIRLRRHRGWLGTGWRGLSKDFVSQWLLAGTGECWTLGHTRVGRTRSTLHKVRPALASQTTRSKECKRRGSREKPKDSSRLTGRSQRRVESCLGCIQLASLALPKGLNPLSDHTLLPKVCRGYTKLGWHALSKDSSRRMDQSPARPKYHRGCIRRGSPVRRWGSPGRTREDSPERSRRVAILPHHPMRPRTRLLAA